MDINKEEPTEAGIYVAYIDDLEMYVPYARKILLMWIPNEGWHALFDPITPYPRKVYGHIGPLPRLLINEGKKE